jgi:predicted nucleotidyltransferase
MFQELLKRIARALDDAHIPYMVSGGQAVLLYGEPRLTRDIDITLGLGVEGLKQLEELTAALGLRSLVAQEKDFVTRTMVLPTIDDRSGIRVDFIFSFSPYERQALARAKKIELQGTPVTFVALEDVVIHKVIAGRARDIEDIKAMLVKNPEYDSEYIERWLQAFDESLSEQFRAVFKRIIEELRLCGEARR